MQLYFIRHAQSTNNHLWERTESDDGREEDAEVTDVGRRQIALLAEHLAHDDPNADAPRYDHMNATGFGLTHIYASPMVRSIETALPIARAVGLTVEMWDEIYESGGIWQADERGERIGQAGKNRADFQHRFPELRLPDWLGEAGWWNNRPHESRAESAARAERVWHALIQRHGEMPDHVALVSHGDFFGHFMAAALGMSTRDGYYFKMNNCAITRFDHHEHGFDSTSLVYMNRVCYLPGELTT